MSADMVQVPYFSRSWRAGGFGGPSPGTAVPHSGHLIRPHPALAAAFAIARLNPILATAVQLATDHPNPNVHLLDVQFKDGKGGKSVEIVSAGPVGQFLPGCRMHPKGGIVI